MSGGSIVSFPAETPAFLVLAEALRQMPRSPLFGWFRRYCLHPLACTHCTPGSGTSVEGSMTVNLDGTAKNDQRAEHGGAEPGRRFTLAAALIVLSVVLGVFLIWETLPAFSSFSQACCLHLFSMPAPGHLVRSFLSAVPG